MFKVVKVLRVQKPGTYILTTVSTARCACKLIIMYVHMYSESHIHVMLSHYMCIRERDSHSICTRCIN